MLEALSSRKADKARSFIRSDAYCGERWSVSDDCEKSHEAIEYRASSVTKNVVREVAV